MEWVGIRELKARTSEVMRKLREEKAEYVITYRGKPCAILLPIDEEALEDYLLTSHPFSIKMRARTRGEISALQRVVDRVKKLPPERQEAVASRWLQDLEDEAKWEELFSATTEEQWDKLAAQAREAIEAGETEPLEKLLTEDEEA